MVKALFFILLILLSSCTSSQKVKDTINVAISQEPTTFDMMTNTSLSGRIISVGNIYEKLLVLDSEGNIRAELAESYHFSEDNRVLTFVLRRGVLFHNGEEMTSEDVARSLNRWLSLYPKAKEMTKANLFIAESSDRVSIKADSSLLFLPYLIASSPQEAIIVPSSTIDDSTVLKEVIGTGPYKLKEWQRNDKIVLERFDNYVSYGDSSSGRWGKKNAYTKYLTYYFVPDSTTRLLGLESGQYDFINDLMSTDRKRVEERDDLVIIEGDESGSIALVFNKKEGICSSLEIRKAISFSLDSRTLMVALYGSYGFNLHSDYMEQWQKEWRVDEKNEYDEQNIKKAEEIVEKQDNKTIRILSSSLSNFDRMAMAVKEELERVGFTVELTVLDWASFIEKRKDSGSWDIYLSAFTSVPLPQMKSYLSPSFPGKIDEETIGYKLLKKMDNASCFEEATQIWKEAQKALWEYIPCYIAGHYITSYAANKSLEGIITQNGFFFWNTRVLEKKGER